MTEDGLWSDESHLNLNTSVWEKQNNELTDPDNLIGYLPVLKENKQDPAPTLTRTAKTDQTALTISGTLNGAELASNGQLPGGQRPRPANRHRRQHRRRNHLGRCPAPAIFKR